MHPETETRNEELDVQLVTEEEFSLVREDELDEAMFACCCSSTCTCCSVEQQVV